MTLESAIKHCMDVADYDCFTDDQRKCSEEHRQLADWLRDYKRLLEEPVTHEERTKTHACDLISSQAVIDALKICDNNEDGINCHKCPLRDKRWDGAWQDDETNCYTKLMRDSAKLLEIPSAQPRKGKWIGKEQYANSPEYYSWQCSVCGIVLEDPTLDKPYPFCPICGSYNGGEE